MAYVKSVMVIKYFIACHLRKCLCIWNVETLFPKKLICQCPSSLFLQEFDASNPAIARTTGLSLQLLVGRYQLASREGQDDMKYDEKQSYWNT